MTIRTIFSAAATATLALAFASPAFAAYDGTHCKKPGVCWEPQPGYPAQLVGSKYDPHFDPAELAKQQEAEDAMVARNKARTAYFIKTGTWIEDVNQIPK
ncbi:methanol dehydrogenase [cytochrome c] subunit [Acidomonas methanolica]|uniref:methanol dehydrogenase [cytochrome c] subunit n=1 Tax=Acidomonas methanolica TaxID=437 RepID=UPI002119CA16|nr:methanol dehydrogenase [cytochrome c] subunit [Acidomonas methanolica]MCQ9155742.1 methanol dehydrogenase [Acidomonas methanolica]